MKKKLIFLVCVLLTVLTILVACDETPQQIELHDHTYNDVWLTDATNHWHAATCTDDEACKTAKTSQAAHTDTDSDKRCDVCGYDYDHTHAWADEWTGDESGHYYAVTCGCSIEPKEFAAHKDAENDGVCDICHYDGGHTHTFITDAWATNDTHHWQAASCSHDVKDQEERHDFDDMDRCAVCGYIKGGIDVKKAIEMGDYYSALVNGGSVLYVRDAGDGMIVREQASFTLGTKQTVIHVKAPLWNRDDTYYYTRTAQGIFGVREFVDDVSGEAAVERVVDATSSLLNGYAFNGIFGSDTTETETFYGVSDLIVKLYEMAGGDLIEEYVMQREGKTYYVFSFETDYTPAEDGSDVSVYRMTVSFSLGEEYHFDGVTVTSERYAYTPDVDEASGATLTTYHQKNLYPNGVFEYTVTQTTGARADEQKYVPEKVLMTSFEIYLPLRNEDGTFRRENDKFVFDTVPFTDTTIVAYPGEYFPILIKPLAPATAQYELDIIKINGETSWGQAYLSTQGMMPGISTLEISSVLCNKKFVLKVKQPLVSALYPSIKDEGISISQNSYTAVLDENGKKTLTISATVNSGADGRYTATIDHGTLDLNFDGTYDFEATEPGVYVITLTSTANPAVTATLTITIEEPVLVGSKFSITKDGYTSYLTFGSNGLLFFDNNGNKGAFIGKPNGYYIYNYDAKTETVAVTGIEFIIARSAENNGWTFFWTNEMLGEPLKMTYVKKVGIVEGKPEDKDTGLSGNYKVFNGAVMLNFAEDGVLTVEDNYNVGPSNLSGSYFYTIGATGGVTITKSDGEEVTNFWILVNRNGKYQFQMVGVMLSQEMVKVTEDAEYTGFSGIFSTQQGQVLLTFYKGVLTLVDNFNFPKNTWSGTYFYTVDENNALIVTDTTGAVVTDFWFVTTAQGEFEFQSVGIIQPQPLLPMNGGEGGEDNGGMSKAIYAYDDPEMIGLKGVYVIDFERMTMEFMRQCWYPDFTAYEIDEDNNIIFTWENAAWVEEHLGGVTFVYNPDKDTITMTMEGESFVLRRQALD